MAIIALSSCSLFEDEKPSKETEGVKTIVELQTDSSFYIFYDKNQLIQANTLSKTLQETDCKITLHQNCRNTKKIAITASSVIKGSEINLMASLAEGTNSVMHFCNQNKMAEVIEEIINKLIKEGVDSKEIVILTLNSIGVSNFINQNNNKRFKFNKCYSLLTIFIIP